jgi:hypothetical protein
VGDNKKVNGENKCTVNTFSDIDQVKMKGNLRLHCIKMLCTQLQQEDVKDTTARLFILVAAKTQKQGTNKSKTIRKAYHDEVLS